MPITCKSSLLPSELAGYLSGTCRVLVGYLSGCGICYFCKFIFFLSYPTCEVLNVRRERNYGTFRPIWAWVTCI